MKNKLKKTLYCAGALLTVALAAFFFDRCFIRYYKTEIEPKSLAVAKELSQELRKRGAGSDCEIKFFTSQAWIKNPYLERPSERVYETRVFAVFCRLNQTEAHELSSRQPMLMIGITDGKPDLPMEVF